MNQEEMIAHWVGIVVAVIAFCGSWIYCIAEYGYLLGFGLGWLPSIILAALGSGPINGIPNRYRV